MTKQQASVQNCLDLFLDEKLSFLEHINEKNNESKNRDSSLLTVCIFYQTSFGLWK